MSDIKFNTNNIIKFWQREGAIGHLKFVWLLKTLLYLQEIGDNFGFIHVLRFINDWLNFCSIPKKWLHLNLKPKFIVKLLTSRMFPHINDYKIISTIVKNDQLYDEQKNISYENYYGAFKTLNINKKYKLCDKMYKRFTDHNRVSNTLYGNGTPARVISERKIQQLTTPNRNYIRNIPNRKYAPSNVRIYGSHNQCNCNAPCLHWEDDLVIHPDYTTKYLCQSYEGYPYHNNYVDLRGQFRRKHKNKHRDKTVDKQKIRMPRKTNVGGAKFMNDIDIVVC